MSFKSALLLLCLVLHSEAVSVSNQITVFGNAHMLASDLQQLAESVFAKSDVLVSLVSKLQHVRARDVCSKIRPGGPVSHFLGHMTSSARNIPYATNLVHSQLLPDQGVMLQLGEESQMTLGEEGNTLGCLMSVLFGLLELVAFVVWVYSIVLLSRAVNLECRFQQRVSKDRSSKCSEMKKKWVWVTRTLWSMAALVIAGGGLMHLCQFMHTRNTKSQNVDSSPVYLESISFQLLPDTSIINLRKFEKDVLEYAILAPKSASSVSFLVHCHNPQTCVVRMDGDDVETDEPTPLQNIPSVVGDIRTIRFQVTDSQLPLYSRMYEIYLQKTSDL